MDSIDDLEFILTRSMAYKLDELNNLIKVKEQLLIIKNSNIYDNYKIDEELYNTEKKIVKLKKEFILEFQNENKEAIDIYWNMRSNE